MSMANNSNRGLQAAANAPWRRKHLRSGQASKVAVLVATSGMLAYVVPAFAGGPRAATASPPSRGCMAPWGDAGYRSVGWRFRGMKQLNSVASQCAQACSKAPRLLPARRAVSQPGNLYKGWERLNNRRSWDFLLGASPFSWEENLPIADEDGYMDNLEWVDGVLAKDMPDNASLKYPAAFTSYLSRLLLSRDERCARWWAGAQAVSGQSRETLFKRFEASLDMELSHNWTGHAGELAAALIERFDRRFPFDSVQQIRLCFTLLPVRINDSFFNQEFHASRDELREAFNVIDKDGKGVLSREDITNAFKAMGVRIFKPESQEMLKDALANSNEEVDFAGFKEAIISSHTAPRYRRAQGIPDIEWWRDPAACVPSQLLLNSSSDSLRQAWQCYQAELRHKFGAEMTQPPISREGVLGPKVYALFALAGIFACTLNHVLLVPIDVVKTMQQTEPWRFVGLGLYSGAVRICSEDGPSALLLGLTPTFVGYFWYGATVYPGYEFFKRKLLSLCRPRLAAKIRVPLVLLAGAIATFFACIGVCPAESVRIRSVKMHGFQMSFLHPVAPLYAGFTPLLFRQVLFGMAKFLMFDTCAALVYCRFPQLARKKRTALLVSLLSGALAGLVATTVSQPSDAILTCLASSPELGLCGAAASLWSKGGASAFFAGFRTRAVWAAAIIAGQFLVYDVVKTLCKVMSANLSQGAAVLDTALSSCRSRSVRS